MLWLQSMVVRYLETCHPFVRRVLTLVGIVELGTTTVSVGSATWTVATRKLNFTQLGSLLSDPLTAFAIATGWGTAAFDGTILFPLVSDLFDILSLSVAALVPNPTELNPDDGQSVDSTLLADIEFASIGNPPSLEFLGLSLQLDTSSSPPGVSGLLNADLTDGLTLTLAQFDPTWSISATLSGGLAAGANISLVPPLNLQVVPPSASASGAIAIRLLGQNPDGQTPIMLFGAANSSYLQALTLSASVATQFTANTSGPPASAAITLEIKTTGGQFLLDTSDADNFLQQILPTGGISASFDFDLTWDPTHGFRMNGGAGLSAWYTLHVSLGPIEIDSVGIGLTWQDFTVDCAHHGQWQRHAGPDQRGS